MKKTTIYLIALCALSAAVFAATPEVSVVDRNGHLGTKGNHILNEHGEITQLRGLCTHGLQWRGAFYESGKAIEVAAEKWGADVIRVAVYVYEGGYLDNKKLSPADFDVMIENIVDSCIEAGIYCIIDWHVHHPGDPAFYLDDAKIFFAKYSKKYAGVPNVIYEIANEPNPTGLEGVVKGRYVEWGDIAAYADEIIPIIRANAPKSLILVGTPAWCSFGLSKGRDWREVANNPLPYENVAYVVHFYAAGHKFYRQIDEIAARIPLFATEWAAATWETHSDNDLVKAQPWIEMVNRHKISWTYWNYAAGKSVFNTFDASTSNDGPFLPTGDNVSESGKLVYFLLNTPRDAWDATAPPQQKTGFFTRVGKALAKPFRRARASQSDPSH